MTDTDDVLDQLWRAFATDPAGPGPIHVPAQTIVDAHSTIVVLAARARHLAALVDQHADTLTELRAQHHADREHATQLHRAETARLRDRANIQAGITHRRRERHRRRTLAAITAYRRAIEELPDTIRDRRAHVEPRLAADADAALLGEVIDTITAAGRALDGATGPAVQLQGVSA